MQLEKVRAGARTLSERAGLGSSKAGGDGAAEGGHIYVHLVVGKV